MTDVQSPRTEVTAKMHRGLGAYRSGQYSQPSNKQEVSTTSSRSHIQSKKDRILAADSFQNKFFDTEHLKADLKGRSVRGGAAIMASQWTLLFLNIGSTAILARLLTPRDYGLVAMVTAVTGFVMIFKDLGLSMATVQKAEVNHGQISTLFWINVLLSFGVMLVIAALAPVIAWFYGEPRLTWITLVLSGAFIFGGLTVQHQALLRRQMRFTTLAMIHILSVLAGIITSIVAAFYGAGYWSLVLMQLVTSITNAAAVWIICDWRPGLPIWRSGVREMLAFGGNLTGFNLLNYFARNADNLLIGKFCGAGQLGLYSKAYGLLLLPIGQIKGPIAAVAIPSMSRLKDEPEKYRSYYYRAMNIMAFITMPLVAMLAALSNEVVTILLGKQWMDSAIIFKVLALAAVFQPLWSALGWIFTSLGQTERMMRWAMVMVPLIVLSFLVGLPWGALGVATSYTLCYLSLILVPSFLYAYRYSPVNLTGLFRAIRCPLLLSLCVYCATEFFRCYVPIEGSFLKLFYCSLLGISVFVLGLIVWPRAKGEAFHVIKTVWLLRKPSAP